MRIPLAVDLKINAFSGSAISDYDAGITNGIIKKKAGRLFVTQRPAINLFEDASDYIAAQRGRGIYYWGSASDLYIINDSSVYKGSQSSVALGSITSGTKRCTILELGSKLVILDAQNDQGWTVTTGGTLAQITDVDFPPKQTPAIGLAYGGAVLNNVLYVLDENGDVYNSGDGDPTTWSALNYLNAQRDPDGGSYLGKHHDNLVVLGPRSIEFFYDAGNTSGSPLSRRADIAYRIGCNDGENVWEVGDRLFFIGVNEAGSLSAYKIENFQVTPISTEDVDAFLTGAIVHNGYSCAGSGFSANGHYFFILSLYLLDASGNIATERSLVYDDTAGVWYPSWTTSIGGHTQFPLIAWSVRASLAARIGEGILANGDLISPKDDLVPQDTKGGNTYMTDGYVATGYVTSVAADGTAIPVIIRTGQNDFGTDHWKRPTRLRLVGDRAAASQTVTVKWANENNSSFNSGLSLDAGADRSLTRLGRFRRRNHQLEHSATEKLEQEALELEATAL